MSDAPGQLKLTLSSDDNKSQSKSPAKSSRAPATARQAIAPPSKDKPKTSTTCNTTEVIDMTEPKKSVDFESMLAELEKVVGQLEGELKLEEALGLFERGLGLSQECEKFLKAAQQKIEILKRSASGEISTSAFAEETEAIV